jgi:hypothetical protein
MILIYLMYNLIKMVLQAKKNLDLYRKKMEGQRRNAMNKDDGNNRYSKNGKVIELDKNQYKVE